MLFLVINIRLTIIGAFNSSCINHGCSCEPDWETLSDWEFEPCIHAFAKKDTSCHWERLLKIRQFYSEKHHCIIMSILLDNHLPFTAYSSLNFSASCSLSAAFCIVSQSRIKDATYWSSLWNRSTSLSS